MTARATQTFLVAASILFTLAAATAVAQPAARAILQPVSDRKAAPQFSLKDSTGKTKSLTDYRGKVLFSNRASSLKHPDHGLRLLHNQS